MPVFVVGYDAPDPEYPNGLVFIDFFVRCCQPSAPDQRGVKDEALSNQPCILFGG
jgi:hypothetical protein